MGNVRDVLLSKEAFKDYGDEGLLEILTDCSDIVWEDSYLDHHRWYYLQEVVVKVWGLEEEIFVKYQRYGMTGDACMGDMDIEYDLDDFYIVEKKKRTVEEIYYG